jgi:hypothetical protein
MGGFANWAPIIRLAGFACNVVVWGERILGFGSELPLRGYHLQGHRLQPPATTVFRNLSRQFAERCELSELSELSRLAEAACGQHSKGLWPALGLSMGFAHRIDADCVYFRANKIVDGLFFLF